MTNILLYLEKVNTILDLNIDLNKEMIYQRIISENNSKKLSGEYQVFQIKNIDNTLYYFRHNDYINNNRIQSREIIFEKEIKSEKDLNEAISDIIVNSYLTSFIFSDKSKEKTNDFNKKYSLKEDYFYMGIYDGKEIYLKKDKIKNKYKQLKINLLSL